MDAESRQPVVRSVLIIEDEPLLSLALADHLSGSGLRVQASDGGKEGLHLALLTKPDIILLDLIMPDLSGIGVLRKLRRDPWGSLVPVIVMTNLPSESKEEASKGLGVAGYLLKSEHSLEQIAQMVNDVLAAPTVHLADSENT